MLNLRRTEVAVVDRIGVAFCLREGFLARNLPRHSLIAASCLLRPLPAGFLRYVRRTRAWFTAGRLLLGSEEAAGAAVR